ncbi:MAG: FRG domain-containing protein [Gammaproteobacteria bacterium]
MRCTKNGGLTESHEKEFQNLFDLMICLRHLGFPSPLLDWSQDSRVAAFFAASSFQNEPLAIIRMKSHPEFDPFGLRLHRSQFNFVKHERHILQASVYTLLTQQAHSDILGKPEMRQGPIFCLRPYEQLTHETIELQKFVITESENREDRLKILKELYDDGFSYSRIYGDTDLLENTVLKDIAINAILLNRLAPVPSSPREVVEGI